MRKVARVLPLAFVPLFLTTAGPTPSAVGGIGNVVVEITSTPAFSPSVVKINLDTSVTWVNPNNMTHTATSNDGFFDTGSITQNDEDSIEFEAAGTYRYHCEFHASMDGTVKVKMAKSGNPVAGWILRWASAGADAGYEYDVQVDKPGDDGFVNFRNNTSRRTATFNPSRNGTYKFRVRTLDGGQSTGYSPVVTVGIK